jgi:hypothetical protein
LVTGSVKRTIRALVVLDPPSALGPGANVQIQKAQTDTKAGS